MERGALFSGWVRVDDRLIHGQVTVGWWQHLRFREIWVVDDLVRDDPYVRDALRLAAPAGVKVQVLAVTEATAVLTAEAASLGMGRGQAVLMLVREPEVVLALIEGGVWIARVNVGNLGSRPGSVRAVKNISLTATQIAALDALAERGIAVFFQLAPEDVRLEWEVVRRRVRR
jgi:mannose/fructose/N-acetylgalactosamine-specific phosphotransferase system component IIB